MLYFAGRNFWKAFKIVGLEARKSRRGVEQDVLFCLFPRPPRLNHAHSGMM